MRRAGVVAPPDTARDVILAFLAVAAGCVDAVSFLGLGQVLTAAMTGNTVLLGLALGQADVQAALRSSVALLGFFAGTLLGASIAERDAGPIWSPTVAAALVLELVLLAALAATWHRAEGHSSIDPRYPLIALAGLAMGLQSVVAHRAGVTGVATTYVTGTLTTLATRLVRSSRRRAPRKPWGEDTAPVWFPAVVWLAYGLGAAFAGATYRWWASAASIVAIEDVRWSSAALAVPIIIVGIAAAVVIVRWRRHKATA